MALLCVSHVHGYLPNFKVSQVLELADFDRGLNHELISNYQVKPFSHVGTSQYISNVMFLFLPRLLINYSILFLYSCNGFTPFTLSSIFLFCYMYSYMCCKRHLHDDFLKMDLCRMDDITDLFYLQILPFIKTSFKGTNKYTI